jgi:surfeit locus 1 family protein
MKILTLYFSHRWWWTTLLMFLVVAVCLRLAFWQIGRMKQQQAADDHLRAMSSAETLDLNGISGTPDLLSMEYRKATAQGRYDFDHQIALRNQYWGIQDGPAQYGFHLLTPLVLDDARAVLVDRGWIPGEYTIPESWRQFDDDARATVSGVLRLPLLKGEMGGGVPNPTAAPGESVLATWNYLDFERIQQQLPYPLLPVYLQETPGDDVLTLPYESSPEVALSENTHIGYAAMWFFYAALAFFGYPVYLRRRNLSNE